MSNKKNSNDLNEDSLEIYNSTLEDLNDNECDFIDEINIDDEEDNIEENNIEENDEQNKTTAIRHQCDYPEEYKSEMMKQYNDFSKYLSEQITYISIKQSIMGINLNIEKTEARFSMNLKRKEKKIFRSRNGARWVGRLF